MPRQSRLLAPWVGRPGARSALYHCVSRVVNREFVLGRQEKEHFVWLMRRYEGFCGVRILTYCVMSNHFHLLVEVPPRPAEGLPDRELCRRLALIYSETKVEGIRSLLENFRKAGNSAGAEALKERYLYRMWDLSQFMKTLKQCFTRWFNKHHERHGTLWEERFKSVLVEDGYAARVMGAYIDLNPVRAGMVNKLEDYRWCGYGAAMAGSGAARTGIEGLMAEYRQLAGGKGGKPGWSALIREYRVILAGDGKECYRMDPLTGKTVVARRGLSSEDVEKILASGGKLSLAEMLLCRVRALTDGAVLGSERFVNEYFSKRRDLFGPTRKKGARPIHGCETDLHCLRGLRRDTLG